MALYIIIGIIILFIIFVAFNYLKIKNMPVPEDNENVKVLNEKNFQTMINKGLFLVDFWAPWCGPCKMIAPTLNSIAETESDKVTIAKVNVDEEKQISAKYGIRSIPTLIFFKDGKEVKRISGIRSKKQLVAEINKLQTTN